ncbi:MAG: hypothetical protein LBF72_01790 [Holosporales bacterium]|nr:hypothetical protein [Holosporales bacterium]
MNIKLSYFCSDLISSTGKFVYLLTVSTGKPSASIEIELPESIMLNK